MKVGISVDTKTLFAKMKKGEKKMAYAVVNALNNTAKRIQVKMREKVVGDFTVRQRAFIGRQIAKIEKSNFASVRTGKAWVEVNVGKRPKLLLARFEEGGSAPAWVDSVAKGFVPLPVFGGPARTSRSAKTPKRLKLHNLRFTQTKTRSGTVAWTSPEQDLYVVPGVGVFQRRDTVFGSASRLVYYFHPTLSLDQRLEFVKTGRAVARQWFHEEMERETVKAIAWNAGQG